jgi:hypothetical protein
MVEYEWFYFNSEDRKVSLQHSLTDQDVVTITLLTFNCCVLGLKLGLIPGNPE